MTETQSSERWQVVYSEGLLKKNSNNSIFVPHAELVFAELFYLSKPFKEALISSAIDFFTQHWSISFCHSKQLVVILGGTVI